MIGDAAAAVALRTQCTESTSWIEPYIKPQIPRMCDLASDPHETIDLMQADLTVGEEGFGGYD